MGGDEDARDISRSGRAVFLRIAGVAGSCGPPVEEDPGACPRCPEGSEREPWPALFEGGPALGAAGTIAERAVDPGFLWHPFGTAIDGAAGLQPAVSLVCGAVAG